MIQVTNKDMWNRRKQEEKPLNTHETNNKNKQKKYWQNKNMRASEVYACK